MADGMDGFDRWLRQQLSATLDDAAGAPRRRLPLPGAPAARRAHPRRDGFLAGALTTAVVFGVLWAGTSLAGRHGAPSPSGQAATAAGGVLATVPLPDPAFTIAAGEGGVWVPDDRQGTLLRIDPHSARVVAIIPIAARRPVLGAVFDAVATSPGAVWVTSVVDDSLLRIDPASNRVAQRIALGMRPTSLAILGGDVWVTGSQANRVLRVSVQSGALQSRLDVADPGPISAGAGAVWVVSEHEGVLSRVDPATARVTPVFTSAASSDYVVDAVVAGGDGVWVRNLAAQRVERVDTVAGAVAADAAVDGPVASPPEPFTIARTADAVWVTISNALVRVDVRSLQTSRLPLIAPTGIAAGEDGTLWVATANADVVHVAPGSG